MGTKCALVLLAALWVAAGCAEDNSRDPYEPGPSDVSGVVAEASSGDGSPGGIDVIARRDREVSTATDTFGDFRLPNSPTGDLTVIFRRSGCEASLPIGPVPSRSKVRLGGVHLGCTSAQVDRVSEAFLAVLRVDPSFDGELALCVRVGNDFRPREADAMSADVRYEDGQFASWSDLEAGDILRVSGYRPGPGRPGTLQAERIEIAGRDGLDRCSIFE